MTGRHGGRGEKDKMATQEAAWYPCPRDTRPLVPDRGQLGSGLISWLEIFTS